MCKKINTTKIEWTTKMLYHVVDTLEDEERPLKAAFCAGVLLQLDMASDKRFLKMLGLKKIEDDEEE